MAYTGEDEAREAILKRIAEIAPNIPTTHGIRDLAEAFAWAVSPAQPHGSQVSTK